VKATSHFVIIFAPGWGSITNSDLRLLQKVAEHPVINRRSIKKIILLQKLSRSNQNVYAVKIKQAAMRPVLVSV
jgi:hypothetical protein